MNETYLAYGVLIAVCAGAIWAFTSDASESSSYIVWVPAVILMGFGVLIAGGAILMSLCWALSVVFP
jgi:hypothetical protein